LSAGSSMTRCIMLANVRLGLDDYSAGSSFIRSTLENCAEQIARHDLGFAIVEIAPKNSSHCA
jgi:hypothetical protein